MLPGVTVVTVMRLCYSCKCDEVVLPGVTVVTVMRLCCQVLQNLGKADKTTDDAFDVHVLNLSKQQVRCYVQTMLYYFHKNAYKCQKC